MRARAARNNAAWCDIVSRSHGLRTRFDDDAWTSETRTPPRYPDAVTLVPGVSVPDLLTRIDTSEGCSIKDSFASLDLSAHGFHVLFEAQWIARSGASPGPDEARPAWERVRSAGGFADWERAWRGDGDPADVLRPKLIDDESIAVLAARTNDQVVAGAILNASESVVGISNFFTTSTDDSDCWSGCIARAESLFPATTFVGYESGSALTAALEHGFQIAGPLRVWTNEG